MLRKLSLVAVAAASLGAAALAPTSASAWGGGWHHGGWHHGYHGWGGPRVFIGGPAYYGGGYGGRFARGPGSSPPGPPRRAGGPRSCPALCFPPPVVPAPRPGGFFCPGSR